MRSTTNRPEPRSPALALALALSAGLIALYLYLIDPPATPAPEPAVPPEAVPAAAATPPPAAPSTAGLELRGVLGSGAIIATPGGERVVWIGREIVPGLRLREVGLHRAVLAWSTGTVELVLDGRGTETAHAAPAPASAADPALEARREETLRYRLGLAPRRAGDRITGFAIRPDADVPMLRRAGLRPGDILVAVNGQSFDSAEKVMELAAEIAGSFTAEFEFERAGRRRRATLEVNPRP